MNNLPIQLKDDNFKFVKVKGKDPSVSGIGWQNNGKSFTEVEGWLSKGYNYGVMGGHGGLVIIDADSDIISKIAEKELPETFTVQSGSGKKHYYFICPEIEKKIIFRSEKDFFTEEEKSNPKKEPHYGEIITFGFQAVGPGSTHPDSKKLYIVYKDLPITKTTREVILSAFSDFIPPVVEQTFIPQNFSRPSEFDDIKIQSVINVPKTCNIVHPVHGATNGGNLNINVEKNLWHCFRCDSGGGPLSLIAVLEGIIDCADAKKGVLRGDKFLKTMELAERKYNIARPNYSTLNRIPDSFDEQVIKKGASISFSELMTTEFPEASWILEPFFEADAINMVSAPPNNWKSWLLLFFSEKISKGESIFDKFDTKQTNVMIVNEEDTPKSLQERFKILKIKDKSIPIYFRIAQGTKIETSFTEDIIAECKEKNIGIVIFDSLRSMNSGDENSSKEMQEVMDQFKKLTREKITVVFTHHHRKSNMLNKTDDSEASRGSSAINAAISGHISLREEERNDGTYIIVKHLKSKAGEKLKPFELRIEREREDGDVVSIEFVYTGEGRNIEKKITDAKSSAMFIFSDNPDKWLTKKDLLSVMSGTTARRVLKMLSDEKLIIARFKKELDGITNERGGWNEIYYKLNTNNDELTKDN